MALERAGTIDDFAERLSLALGTANMSGAQLAAAVGVDKSVVSRWLSGQVQPTAYNMARLSAAIAKVHPSFNLTLWSAPRAQFEQAIGINRRNGPISNVTPQGRSGTRTETYRLEAWWAGIVARS